MPELPEPKTHPHPWTDAFPRREPASVAAKSALPFHSYAELQVTSNFTFLTGASHPDELVMQAASLGYAGIAITDRNSLAGVVRAHLAAKEAGLPFAVGCRLELVPPWVNALQENGTTDKHGWTRIREVSDGMNGSHHEVDSNPIPVHPCPSVVPPKLSILVYATDRASYGRLCTLLTLGKRRAPKGECHLTIHDLIEHQAGMLAVVIPPRNAHHLDHNFIELLQGLKRHFTEDRLSLAVSRLHEQDDLQHLEQMDSLSEYVNIPLTAVNDVHYHHPSRRALQDVITCIRHGCTLDEAGFRLYANAERHLKHPNAIARLLGEGRAHAMRRSVEIAQRSAAFSLDELRYEYPDEVVPAGCTPMQHLIDLTWQGAAERYPNGITEKVRGQIEHEFRLIDELKYAPYFLTVHDLVVYARSRGILCQGRGAAANSAVCYCLGVTAVDPERIDVLFERFVSKERNEPPDIDIDFEHERREEVIQYIYTKYGRDRAALTAEVITYRGRSAIREVGKALGLSLDCVDRLAKSSDWWQSGGADAKRLRELGLNPQDPTMMRLTKLVGEILGFPRHLSQHVGGFVITRGPLCESVPIENARMADRTVIEWDKDDIDALGMLKVDVLGLGMLTCIRKALEFVNAAPRSHSRGLQPAAGTCANAVAKTKQAPHPSAGQAPPRNGARRLSQSFDRNQNLVYAALYSSDSQSSVAPIAPIATIPALLQSKIQNPKSKITYPLHLHTIPPEDPAVYNMICRADTIGVFQIESRAQMSMLPRLRPRCFYDLVIEVAIVRPGPIQGDMVHPYLRRRNGQEAITYPSDAVRRVLGKTLGVPLFQEQAMSLAMVAAGFTAGEADQLRRAIAAWKTKGNQIAQFGERLMGGMIANGYEPEFARRCFEQVKGFSGYGFPESHAASFALLVYVSAWLKCHEPAAFAAALINSQPMGFYAPAQIVRDAREHGVEVRPVDVNHSGWDCRLEECAMRLGLRLVRGLSEKDGKAIEAAVQQHGPFHSMEALHRVSGVRISVMRKLANADAFGSMGLDRQAALWQVRSLRDEKLPLFDTPPQARSIHPSLEGGGTSSPLRASVPFRGFRGCLSGGASIPALPPISELRKVTHDYHAVGLSLRAHPISFIRDELTRMRATPNGELKDESRWPHGSRIAVGGLVLVRQRPSTANGIIFMTIEDESGIANIIVRPKVYERCRRAARHGVVIIIHGRVERAPHTSGGGEVVHVLAHRIEDVPLREREGGAGGDDAQIEQKSRDFH